MPDAGPEAPMLASGLFPKIECIDDIEALFSDHDDAQEAALAFVLKMAAISNRARRTAFAVYLYYELWEPLGYRTALDGAKSDQLFDLSDRSFYRWKGELGFIDSARSVATSEGMLRSQRIRESKARAIAKRIGVSGDQLQLFEPTGRYVGQVGSRLRRLGAHHLSMKARRELYRLGMEELRIGLGITKKPRRVSHAGSHAT